ncbi:MAG: hypothetical protein NXH95_11120 [Pseudomonadaceae bacterium]|nr:hypothetical protein [Pseudomonadaceae bacterium]
MPRQQAMGLHSLFIVLMLGCAPEVQTAGTATGPAPALLYSADFDATFTAHSEEVTASITIRQKSSQLRSLNFKAPQAAYQLISADGEATRQNNRLIWQVPAEGGTIRYTYRVDSPRGDGFDAKHTSTWTLLRLGDLFPAATARLRKGAQSVSSVFIQGPKDWSFESRYGSLHAERKILDNTDRSFNRPTGWLVGGLLGTRRDIIAGHNFVVSAPIGGGMQRMDVLAFLNWTVPTLNDILPELPPHVLVVGAPAIMWRGGLSAPNSIYLHVDRPLVSENGTSTLLHELVHMAGVHSAAPGADWIVEGLAEYYAIAVMQRSGGLSPARFEATLEDLRDWVKKDNGKLSDPSSGANTAAAVLLLHDLNKELAAADAQMDDLLHNLLEAPEISVATLNQIAAELLGHPSQVLSKIKQAR